MPAVWSDSSIDWALFDHIIIRNTWDYTNRLGEFLTWVKSNDSRIRNSFETIRWNCDKIYLKDLASAGFPVVDTQFVSSAYSDWEPPSTADFVVKPTVSAGSQDTMRFPAGSPDSKRNAQDLINQIVSEGKTVMVQPYLAAVDEVGETAQLFIGGDYSHAVRKGPLLAPNVLADKEHGLFLKEDISPRDPSLAQRELADAVIEYVDRNFGTPLYARVDLLDDPSGRPVILELELVEPSMFFVTALDSAERLTTLFTE